MAKLSEKQFLVLVGVPACAVILFILYYMLFGSQKNKNRQEGNNNSSIILPEAISDTGYKPKTSVYEELENKESQDKMHKKMMKDESFFDMNDNEVQPSDKEIKVRDNSKVAASSAPVVKQSVVPGVKNYPSVPKKEDVPLRQSVAPAIQQSPAPAPENNDNGFGVYQGKKSNTGATQTDNKEFIPAFLDEGKKIKEGTEVVFILQKNATINGFYFEKMSIMYGMASFNGSRIHITINTIQDKNGQKHSVSLTGYNENYQKGINYEDKLDQVVDQSKTNAVALTGSQIGQITGGGLIASTINAGSRLISKDRGEISIAQGYKMYFKRD